MSSYIDLPRSGEPVQYTEFDLGTYETNVPDDEDEDYGVLVEINPFWLLVIVLLWSYLWLIAWPLSLIGIRIWPF